MTIELTDGEARVLLELLRGQLGNLKAEINRTETTGYREELKTREAVIVSLIDRLSALGVDG